MNGFTEISLNWNSIDRYYHRKSLLKSLTHFLPEFKGQFLDVGCGKMPYRQYILENSMVKEYTGLDIENAITYDENIKPDVEWDGEHMPFEDDSYDTVMATEVLEHCPDPGVTITEIHRVLKNDGLIFITVPFLWGLHEAPHDYYRYTPYALEHLLSKAGFHDIKVEALGGWHASMAQMLGLWVKRGFRQKPFNYLLYLLFYPFYCSLLKLDKPVIEDNTMVTGLSVIARKK